MSQKIATKMDTLSMYEKIRFYKIINFLCMYNIPKVHFLAVSKAYNLFLTSKLQIVVFMFQVSIFNELMSFGSNSFIKVALIQSISMVSLQHKTYHTSFKYARNYYKRKLSNQIIALWQIASYFIYLRLNFKNAPYLMRLLQQNSLIPSS